MDRSKSEIGEIVTSHLVALADGRCTITEAQIEAEDDPLLRELLSALLVLFEELEFERTENKSLEDRFQALTHSAPDAIISTDEVGSIETWNIAASKMFGYSEDEMIGRSLSELVPDWDAGDGELVERSAIRADGQRLPVELAIARWESYGRMLYCAILRDVTERRRIERELREAQKLESIGRLAAGIAHELNTPLQYIGDNADFVKVGLSQMEGALDAYQQAVETAGAPGRDRALEIADRVKLGKLREQLPVAIEAAIDGLADVSRIVGALGTFSRHGTGSRSLVDVNEAIARSVIVSQSEWKLVAEIDTDLAPDLPQVPCVAGELDQVLLALIVNAAHAIEDHGGSGKGQISLRTWREGAAVTISISDTGIGIPDSIADSIFDPFFTTKAVGRGSGQGLAIARNIVDKHGGSLTFDTEPGRKTTFVIRLPIE